MSYTLYHRVVRDGRTYLLSAEFIDKCHARDVAARCLPAPGVTEAELEDFFTGDLRDDPDVRQQWAEQNLDIDDLREGHAEARALSADADTYEDD